jgi:hypothetical protein
VAALAVHIADEAMTGFLDFYNPLVLSIRARTPWFPMPTFAFDDWLRLLTLAVLVLAAVSPWIRRGGTGPAAASWIFSVVMFLNGVGHLAGSVFVERWLPGATSAPLLLVASAMLARRTLNRRASARSVGGT